VCDGHRHRSARFADGGDFQDTSVAPFADVPFEIVAAAAVAGSWPDTAPIAEQNMAVSERLCLSHVSITACRSAQNRWTLRPRRREAWLKLKTVFHYWSPRSSLPPRPVGFQTQDWQALDRR